MDESENVNSAPPVPTPEQPAKKIRLFPVVINSLPGGTVDALNSLRAAQSPELNFTAYCRETLIHYPTVVQRYAELYAVHTKLQKELANLEKTGKPGPVPVKPPVQAPVADPSGIDWQARCEAAIKLAARIGCVSEKEIRRQLKF